MDNCIYFLLQLLLELDVQIITLEVYGIGFELLEAGLTITRGAVNDGFDRLQLEFQCVGRVRLAGTE